MNRIEASKHITRIMIASNICQNNAEDAENSNMPEIAEDLYRAEDMLVKAAHAFAQHHKIKINWKAVTA